jgi:hypothetical protein
LIYTLKKTKETKATMADDENYKNHEEHDKHLTRHEYVWRELCARLPKLPKKKFRMLSRDAYASLLLHDQVASPREALLVLLERKDPRVTGRVLLQLSKRGKVFESLCWLHARAPDILRTRWSGYSEVLEGELSGPEHHQRLVKSVNRWLAAWSNFIQ